VVLKFRISSLSVSKRRVPCRVSDWLHSQSYWSYMTCCLCVQKPSVHWKLNLFSNCLNIWQHMVYLSVEDLPTLLFAEGDECFVNRAMESNCTNKEFPDRYGHYREAKYCQTKHHWFWKVGALGRRLIPNYELLNILIETMHSCNREQVLHYF